MGECEALQRILKVYELASGQQLNKAKTSLFFSPNMKPEIKNDKAARKVPWAALFGGQEQKEHF